MICYGLDLGKSIQHNNQIVWCFHTYKISLIESKYTCAPSFIFDALSFLELGNCGWLGVLRVVLAQFLDCCSIKFPPYASHSPYFSHPRMTRIHDFSRTPNTCPHLHSWPFGMNWSKFGPARGGWGQFGQFHMYTHIWIPNPLELNQM